MAGGGQMFNVPLEYYGGPALGQGLFQAAQVGQQGIELRRQRKQEDIVQLLQELNAVGEISGKGSEAYNSMAQRVAEAMGLPNATPFVPMQEVMARNVQEALARVQNGTASADDQTLVNQTMYGHALGLPGVRTLGTNEVTQSTQGVEKNAQQLKAGERELKSGQEYDSALAAR